MELELTNKIALAALLLSLLNIYLTYTFQRKQRSLIAVQEKLSQKLLSKERNESNNILKANLDAELHKYAQTSWRLKIFNSGSSIARNVRVAFPGFDEMFSEREINEKFPLERLAPYQSVELLAHVHLGSPQKIKVELYWDDDSKPENTIELFVTR